jgi:3-oxoadipate enol-lactonase
LHIKKADMKIKSNGITIEYDLSGNDSGPVVVLSHSLGCSRQMWEHQVNVLEKDYRVLRYDMRGHGHSEAPAGRYSFDMLGKDAVGLLDALQIDRIHWVGLSIGGMIGQCLALDYPERLSSLVLADTMAIMPDEVQPIWQERITTAREKGMTALVEGTFANWFTPEFLASGNPVIEKIQQQLITTPLDGYIGCIWALRELNYLGRLTEITVPTLIIVGEKDMGTPVAASQAMHGRIRESRLVVLPDAAHLSCIAKPDEFNQSLLGFLQSSTN